MAEVTIRLRFDPETGKKDIWIGYESDDDALPLEHERDHRAIIESLLGQGILRENEVGRVVVERTHAHPQTESAPAAQQDAPPHSEEESA